MAVRKAKPIDDAVREKYDKEFDTKWLASTFFSKVLPAEEACLRKLYHVFTRGNLRGPIKRGIDIGSGPVVHRLSAFSKVCETLVYSDFSSNNLKYLREWLNGSSNDHLHLNMFKFCAKIEGYDDLEKGANEIVQRVKSKVEDIKKLNVLLPNPLGHLEVPFDVAFTVACLESACDTFETYVSALRNISTILRPGGYLLLKSYLENTYYMVNDLEFPSFFLTMEMVKKGLEEGGFRVLEIYHIHEEVEECTHYDEVYFDGTGSCFAIAQKL